MLRMDAETAALLKKLVEGQRLAHLGRVPRAVMYTGNASPVAADVV